jgi:hypothetical protein
VPIAEDVIDPILVEVTKLKTDVTAFAACQTANPGTEPVAILDPHGRVCALDPAGAGVVGVNPLPDLVHFGVDARKHILDAIVDLLASETASVPAVLP